VLGVAKGADDGEAVGAGEHAVEDDGCDGFCGIFFCSEKPGEGGVAVGLVVRAIALSLEVEEEALGEVVFVFDDGDELGCGFSHEVWIFSLIMDAIVVGVS
jgi:hypothetical protein